MEENIERPVCGAAFYAEGEWIIPKGYEAEVKDGKIIVRKKESEDEKTRKAILKLLSAGEWDYADYDVSKEEMLAWLEKQKERGPLTKEEEYTLQRIIEQLEDEGCPQSWKDLLCDIYNLPYEKREEQESEHTKAKLEADLRAEIDVEVMKLRTAPCYDELAAFARHFYNFNPKHK